MYTNHPLRDDCIEEVTNTICDCHCFLGHFFTGSSLSLTYTGAALYSSRTLVPCTLRFVNNCALADWYVTAVSDPLLACLSWLKIVSMADPFARSGEMKLPGCSLRC